MTSDTHDYIKVGDLSIAKPLYDLVKNEIAPGTGVDIKDFWPALARIVRDLGPRNTELLGKRDKIKKKIDT